MLCTSWIDKRTNFEDGMHDSLGINTRDFKMLSLDVQSLLTHVPLNYVLDFLERKTNAGLLTSPIPFNHFCRLIEICFNNCFLEWDGDIYRQTFGVAMGSPLSPVLANLYMEYFETEILLNVAEMPPLWLRYMDDCFVIWPDDRNFGPFLQELNDTVPSIRFSVEYEKIIHVPQP